MKAFVSFLQNSLDLFLESPCPLCERSSSRVICPACQRQLQSCTLARAEKFNHGVTPVVAWGSYGGQLKRTIALLKYHNQPRLARPLGHWLAESWRSVYPQTAPYPVIPIPLHASKQQKRGYNQAELIAQSFCERTGLPLVATGLARIRETDAQFGLSAGDRATNLQGAFGVGAALTDRSPHQPVILLDDIYTTGATIKAAIEVLHRVNIPIHSIAVIARTLKE